MDDAEHRTAPGFGGESIASEVTHQVRAIVSAAEDVADSVKREAEQRAELRLREADAEVARRLRSARAEADHILAERRRRIADLSESILERADAVLARLDEAGGARRDLEAVLASLGETAERVGSEPEADAPARDVEPAAPPTPAVEAGAPMQPAEVRAAEDRPPGDEQPAPELDEGERTPPRATEAPAPEAADHNGGGSSGEPVKAAAPAGRGRNEYGGARQIAVQMAVAGSTRAEVAAHLQRTFDLQDPHTVLNEIFGESDTAPG